MNQDPERRIEGLIAKIYQALQPGLAEMFFTRVPILVEGPEDVAYITSELHLSGLWDEFRRLGCHIVPVNGKHRLIEPVAIAVELGIPAFVIFDADGDIQRHDHRARHESDNRTLQTLLGTNVEPFPDTDVWGENHVIWQTNLADRVRRDFGDNYKRLTEAARQHYAQEGGLEKNGLFIADWLSAARTEMLSSPTLIRLCESIIAFARR